MKQHRIGSALLMILLILAGISTLLLRVHYQCSLLLETVIEREQQLVWYNGTQACMQYALYLAKKNWQYLQDLAGQGAATTFVTSWSLNKQKQVPAHISFRMSGADMHVCVQLYQDNVVKKQISCALKVVELDDKQMVNKVKIYEWRE